MPKDPEQTCSNNGITVVDAVFAVNPDGTEKWVFEGTCQSLIAGPNVGTDGKVYAVTGGDGLGAFALTPAGALDWNGGSFAETDSPGREIVFGPTEQGLAPTQQYFQFTQNGINTSGRLFAYTLPGADVFQKTMTEGGQPAVGPASGNVFVSTHDGAGAQIRSYTPQGALRWNSSVYPEQYLTALDPGPDDTVYVTQDGIYIHALAPASGGIKWSHYQPGVTHLAPVADPNERLVLA